MNKSIQKSTTQILKDRLKETRRDITELGYGFAEFRNWAINKHPEFSCPEGWQKIDNAWYLRTGDILVLELMQEFLKDH